MPSTQQAAGDEMRLVSQAQHGDQDAFCRLIYRHRAGLIDVVYRLCGDPALAEDAAQVACVKAWQKLASFRVGSSFRNWLYRIAVNTALDGLRREKPGADFAALELAAPLEPIEARIEQQERAQQVRRAVLALPEFSRAVLVLKEYRGLSYQEIAETLDIPMGTVMSRLSYARRRLSEMLHPYLEEK